MKLIRTAVVLGAFAFPVSAQINITVKSLNDAGICLVKQNTSTVVQNFAANQVFTTYGSLYIREYVSTTDYAYMAHYVYPPYTYNNTTYNRFSFGNYAYAKKGSTHKSLHTTDNKTGTAGTQKHQVTIAAPASTKLILDLSAYGYIYDNSSLTMKLAGDVTRSWSYNTPGYNRTTEQIKATVPAAGKLVIDVELTGACTPGAGTGYYDGYSSSLYCYVYEEVTGSFQTYGTGCGNAVIGGVGQPVRGSYYTLTLDKAPANAPASFLFGTSKDWLYFIKLPLDLTYMGANGCFLNVGFSYPWARVCDAQGHAEVKLYLSQYATGTYFGQWLVFDKNANAAGITLTQGGELKY